MKVFICAGCRTKYGTDYSERLPRPVIIYPERFDESADQEPWIIEGDSYGWHENDGECFLCYSYALFGGALDPIGEGVYPEIYTIRPELFPRNRRRFLSPSQE